jgi:hypothetical protein
VNLGRPVESLHAHNLQISKPDQHSGIFGFFPGLAELSVVCEHMGQHYFHVLKKLIWNFSHSPDSMMRLHFLVLRFVRQRLSSRDGGVNNQGIEWLDLEGEMKLFVPLSYN